MWPQNSACLAVKFVTSERDAHGSTYERRSEVSFGRLGALGRGFGSLGSLGSAGGSSPVVPDAPVLVWTSAASEADPTFDVLLDTPLVGDTIYLQLDTDIAFGSPDEYTNTIDSGEAAAQAVVFSSFVLLTDGVWYARSKHNTSDWSNVETKTISAGAAPVNTVAPTTTGNLQVGQTLSGTDGTWTGTATINFTYQWKRNGSDISGATASTYVAVEADAGQAIRRDVTGTNGTGNSTAASSNSLTIDVYVVFLARIEDTADASVYSGGVWNGVTFGTAATNRKIVLGVGARNSLGDGTLSGATVDGNATSSAILRIGAGSQNKAALRIVDLPTGTSGNITVTWSTTQGRCGAGLWAVYGAASSTASDTDFDEASTVDAASSVTLTVPAKGVAIGYAISVGASALTSTATGLSEAFDAVVESTIAHTGGQLNSSAGGNIALTFTWSTTPSLNGCPGVFASWV
jgi:hypothetical protein